MRWAHVQIVFGMASISFISSCGTPQGPTPTSRPAPKVKAASFPEGIDPKQTSEDPTYGYSKDNAVKVGGPKGFSGPASERLYLRHLRDAQFRPFRFRRRGSFGSGPDGHVLDGYELTDYDGKTVLIYIDMYHADIHPFRVKAPKGMFFLEIVREHDGRQAPAITHGQAEPDTSETDVSET